MELNERDIYTALEFGSYEKPVSHEWLTEGSISYLRIEFSNKEVTDNVIMQGLKVGPAPGLPVIILPWLPDKKVSEMLLHHQVDIECSQPISKSHLSQAFNPFEFIELISDEPISSKFLAVFVRQPHARNMLSKITHIVEPFTFKCTQAEKPINIIRKSYKNSLISEIENWKRQQANQITQPVQQQQQITKPQLTLSSSNQAPVKHEFIPPPTNQDANKCTKFGNKLTIRSTATTPTTEPGR